jgi:magnesium chelatase subunit I
MKEMKGIQGLFEKLSPLGVKASDAAPKVVAAAEFLLEGLVAHRKLSRNEQHGFAAQESVRLREREELSEEHKELEVEYEDWQRARRKRRSGGLN